ncbi:beta-alanine-activating enzyme isoform X2 [Macrosteles quadrilineatus]|uniref:beta-alanine-activating enzyme isoform X2 n=1 Tax=Macrosteles quadrilineatus TaxID=74068 RepID=UPI0023E0D06E|nr:beta-alanine-activating enzyme isoform X2 [Macrosteles quadrilineatus]
MFSMTELCLQNERPIVYIDVENQTDFNKRLIENLHITNLFLDEQSEKLKYVLKSPHVVAQFSIWNMKIQLWETGEIFYRTMDIPVMMYAVQTSGSTGKPKTVQVTEKSILPNILDLKSLWNVTENDVILLASPPSFDPFMVDLLLAVVSGAALLLVSPEVRLSPHYLLETVFPVHSPALVTIAQLTPSIFTRWSVEQIRTRILSEDSNLRVLALGGDKFPPGSWWLQCRADGNRTQLYNLYGTTEVSCWAMMGSGTDGSLGSPLTDTELRVVDSEGRTITDGTGEMYIGSKTRICMVEGDIWDQMTSPVFRPTGDLVTVKNNRYDYIGRKDNLVKRWGHRVSLDDVEAVASEHTDVAAVCCVLCKDILALYICLRKGTSAVHTVKDSLKQILLKRLNKASVPDVILLVDELPLNRHGKINKNKLKMMLPELKDDEAKYENSIDLFKHLWKKYTCQDVTEDSGFLSIGGNSVTAMLIVNSMALRGFDLSMTVLTEMLNNGTLSDSCRLIESYSGSQSLRVTQSHSEPDGNVFKKKKIDNTNDVMFFKMKGSTNNLSEMVESNVLNIAWSYNLGKCVDASPTCLVFRDGSRLAVVGSHSGRLAALSLEKGELLWEIQLPDRIESSVVPSHCGRQGLIGCYDGNVYSISLTCGTILWSFKTAAMVKGTAVATDKSYIIGSYDYHVYCLTTDGRLNWKQKMDGIVLATPVYLPQHSFVIVASLTGQLAGLDGSNGEFKWTICLASPVFSTPCIAKDLVVVAEVEGILHGIQALSGNKVWQYFIGNKIFSSLITVEDSVLFGCHDSSVRRVRVSSPSEMWRHPTDSPVYATPTLLSPQHLVVASTSGVVSVLDITNGSELCSSVLPKEVFSSPVACGGYVVTGCRDDNVYCFLVGNKIL